MFTDQRISELRSHFPILQAKTYLYSCSQGALSDTVEAGLQEYAAKLADVAGSLGRLDGNLRSSAHAVRALHQCGT